MQGFLFLIAACVVAALPTAPAAVEVHRCTARDGAVRYQDTPCAAHEAAETIRLVDDVPHAAPLPRAVERDAGPVTRDSTNAQPAALPDSMPSAYLCVRDDGTRYLSESGYGDRRLVPLAMLGLPGRGLADAYGPGAAGVSAPGVRPPRVVDAPGYAATGHVWVEDPCRVASGDQVCAFLADEIEAAQRKLRFAFSDTTPAIKAQIDALRERAAACAR